ncbi:hypothetical protein [Enterococcus sp. LJL51]|uniref:hypothetical protein n=1 Tax=Enterococcus sp. LJL51 TaxID=3416656 RepID=UPI003CF57311
MGFYTDVQLVSGIEETGEGRCHFEVTFTTDTDNDKKIEQIISKGLNLFQKRNKAIKIEDGYIEFFENQTVVLKIECSSKAGLTSFDQRHLQQELKTVFDLLKSGTQLSPQQKTSAGNQMNEEQNQQWDRWKKGLEENMSALMTETLQDYQQTMKQEITVQLENIQAEMKEEIIGSLAELKEDFEQNYTIANRELLASQAIKTETLQNELKELRHRNKTGISKMKKQLESFTASQKEQNNTLKSSLIEAYQTIAADHEEKADFQKDKLYGELEENMIVLTEEIHQVTAGVKKQLGAETQKINSDIRQLQNTMAELKKQAEQPAASEKRLEEITQELSAQKQLLTAAVEEITNSHKNLSEQVEKAADVSTERMEGVAASLSSVEEQLNSSKTETAEQLEQLKHLEKLLEAQKTNSSFTYFTKTLNNQEKQLHTLISGLEKKEQQIAERMDALEGTLSKITEKLAAVDTQLCSQSEESTQLLENVKQFIEAPPQEDQQLVQLTELLKSEESGFPALSTTLAENNKLFYQRMSDVEDRIKQTHERIDTMDQSILSHLENSSKPVLDFDKLLNTQNEEVKQKVLQDLINNQQAQLTPMVQTLEKNNLKLNQKLSDVEKNIDRISETIANIDKRVAEKTQEQTEPTTVIEELFVKKSEDIQKNTADAQKKQWEPILQSLKESNILFKQKLQAFEKEIESITGKVDGIEYSITDFIEENGKTTTDMSRMLIEQKEELQRLSGGKVTTAVPLSTQALVKNEPVAKEKALKVERLSKEISTEKTKPINEANLSKSEKDETKKAAVSEDTSAVTEKPAPVEKDYKESTAMEKKKPSLVELVDKKATDKTDSKQHKDMTEEEATPTRKLFTGNRFLADYEKVKKLFEESDTAGASRKMVRLNRSEYRKAIVSVNYIEYRWEVVSAHKELFDGYNLKEFKEKAEHVDEFLDSIDSTNRKESLFNQNALRIKNSIWKTAQAYHWLSIYLEEIISKELLE